MVMASAYPRYRESGLPWVPKIPEDWQVLRNGRLFGHRVETGFPDLPILEVSLRTGVRVRDMENLKRKQVMSQKEKYKRAAKDDLAYNMMRMWQGAVGPAPVDGLVSPAYVVVKPYPEANSHYFSYLFRIAAYMQEVNKYSRGIVSDRNRLYWESFKQMPSLAPPRPEQDLIVAYLRAQDAHMVRFIKAKRDLIALLNEDKMGIVHEATTRGIDPSIEFKKPSFEWVDEIPAHWNELPLKQISKLNNSGSYGVNPEDGEVVLPVATTAQIRSDGHFVVDRMPRRGFSCSDADKYVTKPGDILVVKSSGSIFNVISGKVGIVREDAPKFVFSNFLLRLIPDTKKVIPEYLFLLLGGYLTRERVKRMVAGTTFPNLQVGEYRSAVLPVPGIEEQERILTSITEKTLPIDTLIERAIEEIAIISEYRDRLIADVVTGQVDVRGWQPGPDDVVNEEELVALGDDQEDVSEEEDGDGEN